MALSETTFAIKYGEEWYLEYEDSMDLISERILASSFQQNEKDSEGRTWLHLLLSRCCLQYDDDRATSLVERCLELKEVRDDNGKFPLDYFVEDMCLCSDHITSIIESLRERNDFGNYRHVVPILRAYPESLFDSGLFDIVARECYESPFAALRDDPRKALRSLLSIVFQFDENDDDDDTPNNNKNSNFDRPLLPLHVLLRFTSHKFMNRLLIESYITKVSAVQTLVSYDGSDQKKKYKKNDDSRREVVALHMALRYKAPFNVSQKLLEYYPNAINIIDSSNGLFPLQVAAISLSEKKVATTTTTMVETADNDEFNTVYSIIRYRPDQLKIQFSSLFNNYDKNSELLSPKRQRLEE